MKRNNKSKNNEIVQEELILLNPRMVYSHMETILDTAHNSLMVFNLECSISKANILLVDNDFQ